jgi:hypothetical protein
MSLTSPDHRNALRNLRNHLEEEGIPVINLLLGGQEIPYDTLLVGIEAVDETKFWQLELAYLAGLEEDLGEFSLLQLFVPVVDQLGPEAQFALQELIIKVNPKLPLGSFGLLEELGIIYFKHNALLHNDQPAINNHIVQELITLTDYLLNLFDKALTQVARAESTVEAALQDPYLAPIYR